MNLELLREIAQVIPQRPDEFDMMMWHTWYGVRGLTWCYSFGTIPKSCITGRGTTHCVGGWAQVLSPLDVDPRVHSQKDAQRLLQLTDEQAELLFFEVNWPQQFRSYKVDAKLAVARIEHFIATDGRE